MVNKNLQEYLRQKYNPEGSMLRRDQLHLLSMVEHFDGLCKKMNLNWWLSSGTLLGAARHGGFIPWDDDMDIVMMRKDYKRLINNIDIFSSEKYIFHCKETDFNYINVFGKFRERTGNIKTGGWYNYYKYTGIGFDVFSIEKIPYWCARFAEIVYGRFVGVSLKIKNRFIRKKYIRFVQFILLGFIFPILRLLGKYNPKGEYHYELGTGWSKHTFYEKNTFPLTMLEFEGVRFPVPKNTDKYLTKVYGDWRKIPSEEQIKSQIHCPVYRNEIYARKM